MGRLVALPSRGVGDCTGNVQWCNNSNLCLEHPSGAEMQELPPIAQSEWSVETCSTNCLNVEVWKSLWFCVCDVTGWRSSWPLPACILVVVRSWQTGVFCTDESLNKDIQHIQERENKNIFLLLSTSLKEDGWVWKNGGCGFHRHISGWISGVLLQPIAGEQEPTEEKWKLCRARKVLVRPWLPLFGPFGSVRWCECRSLPWETRLLTLPKGTFCRSCCFSAICSHTLCWSECQGLCAAHGSRGQLGWFSCGRVVMGILWARSVNICEEGMWSNFLLSTEPENITGYVLCLCFMALGIQKFEPRLCWLLELQLLMVLSLVSEHFALAVYSVFSL